MKNTSCVEKCFANYILAMPIVLEVREFHIVTLTLEVKKSQARKKQQKKGAFETSLKR
jgi:hypothetical protein